MIKIKRLENHIDQLKTLQEQIPVTCNLSNTQALKELFEAYKFIVYGLPEKFAAIKNYSEGNSYRIRTKIHDAADSRNSWAQKKLLFDEARRAIHNEIGHIIAQLKALTLPID